MSKRRISRSYLKKRKQRLRKKTEQFQLEKLEDKVLLTVGPQLVGIQPNEGALLSDGSQTLNVSPSELTFSFDQNQVIDPSSLSGIQVTGADGGTVTPGYIGIGDTPNQVILRFAEPLADDIYTIDIFGSGTSVLRNDQGDAFNEGIDVSVNFNLDLGAQVIAVNPQPVSTDGSRTQARNQIEVYFNDDDLSSSATNPAFYQLIATNETVENTDDTVHNPVSVTYDAATDKAVLTFASNLEDLSGTGTYRLRIGTNEATPLPAEIRDMGDRDVDDEDMVGSSYATAMNIGTLTSQSITIESAINTETLGVTFPGDINEPGLNPRSPNGAADTEDGITVIEYNFKEILGELDGILQFNLITENQKERAREAFDVWSNYLGVTFIETDEDGITVGTGNPAADGAILDGSLAWDDTLGATSDPNLQSWYVGALTEIGTTILGLQIISDVALPNALVNPDAAVTLLQGSSNCLPALADGELCRTDAAEPIFPGNQDIIQGQHVHRPDSNDIDLYRFNLPSDGFLTLETVAERITDGASPLDSVLTLYRERGATREIVSRNDDYFSEDSLIELDLTAGVYYVAVTAAGNDSFDPIFEDSGANGRSEGAYNLRVNFRPEVTSANALRDTTGVAFDGDADGRPGGIYNFWTRLVPESDTIYVDKSFAGSGNGTLASPYNSISQANDRVRAIRNTINGSEERPLVMRLLGNGGTDGNISTPGDADAYEIGFSALQGTFDDGADFNVPRGVTAIIDQGAVFKMLESTIHVGSSAVTVDRSGGAIQVLGTPDNSVYFTSFNDSSLGGDTSPVLAERGDWGGIIIRNDIDREENAARLPGTPAEDFRDLAETEGAFLSYINHADMRFGGGRVSLDSIEQIINPIHVITARPTISHNRITESADAAMSANPNSFEQSNYIGQDSYSPSRARGLDYQAVPFTPDYQRVGPDIYGNTLLDNTINALFVRIDTPAGDELEKLTVPGRFDDTDIVHAVLENLEIEGESGGLIRNFDDTINGRFDGGLVIDPGIIVKLDGTRIELGIGTTLFAEGTESREVIFTSLRDARYGTGGTFDTNQPLVDLDEPPSPGDWGGFYARIASQLSIDNALMSYGGGEARLEGDLAGFNVIEIHQADARVTNSTIEFSQSGISSAPTNRAGRGVNEQGAIFVRGAQPVIVNNIIRGTEGTLAPAINIDVNSLISDLTPDTGRSTGFFQSFDTLRDNHGPLIRDNALEDNALAGMIVRGGTVTGEGVWDDTDIVHILFEEIVLENHRTFGGLRLESSTNESLVIKLGDPGNAPGSHGIEATRGRAGFFVNGTPADFEDRIGGTLQVVGQPGHPVVMTSLADDTVGAGFTPAGEVLNDTDGGGRPLPTQEPGSFQIELNYGPNITGQPEFLRATELAVEILEELIEDPITVTIDVETVPLPPTLFGTIDNEEATIGYDAIRRAIEQDAGDREHEAAATQLPSFRALDVQLPNQPFNPFSLAEEVEISYANAKAIGFTEGSFPAVTSQFDATETRDASIQLNEIFPWDADRTDGIGFGSYDMAGAMIKLISNALGITSGLGQVNLALGDPALPRDINLHPMDLFRIAPGEGEDDFTNAVRILDPAQQQVFYDGGFFDPYGLGLPDLALGDIPLSPFASDFESAAMQDRAGYSLDTPVYLGAHVAPTLGEETLITEVDRQIFDLIGWDIVGGAIPGDWNGITISRNANANNVGIVTEIEPSNASPGVNALASDAQFLGAITDTFNGGDENLRFGYRVLGDLNDVDDVDVYSFDAAAGTELWVDIDRTSSSLDTIVELINVEDEWLVQSNDSLAEQFGDATVNDRPGVNAFPMLKTPTFDAVDDYSVNRYDAGFRVILPGAPGNMNTYHVRVSSNGGLTAGAYELQLRTPEDDGVSGTTVQFATINYSRQGVDVDGSLLTSPFAGEVSEDTRENDRLPISTFRAYRHDPTPEPLEAFDISDIVGPTPADDTFGSYRDLLRSQPADFGLVVEDTRLNPRPYELEFYDVQNIGTVDATPKGAISLAGSFEPGPNGPDIVDWFEFSVDSTGPFIFDIDYADQLNRPDLAIYIFQPGPFGTDRFFGAKWPELEVELLGANLVAFANSGVDLDDLPAPFQGDDLDDLSRGSLSTNDPMLGPVSLTPGTYLLAIAAEGPEGLEEAEDVNPFLRVQPNSNVERLAATNFDDVTDLTFEPVPFNLSDVSLFVSQTSAVDSMFTDIVTVDPFTGTQETIVGLVEFPDGDDGGGGGTDGAGPKTVADIHMHVDHLLYAYTIGDVDSDGGIASGNYLRLHPSDAIAVPVTDIDDQGGGGGGGGAAGDGTITDDGIETYERAIDEETGMPAMDDDGNFESARTNPDLGEGVQFEAITIIPDNSRASGFAGYAVGTRAIDADWNGPNVNILYTFDVPTGQALSAPPLTGEESGNLEEADIVADDAGPWTNVIPRGILLTDSDPRAGETPIIVAADGSEITDGATFSSGTGATYELETGVAVDVNVDLTDDVFVHDGGGFALNGIRFEFDTGPIISVDATNGGMDINDGDTFTIVDNLGQSLTFEFDSNNALQTGDVAVPFQAGFSQEQLTFAIIDTINNAGFAVGATGIGNRISLTNDSTITAPVSVTPAVGFVGAHGGAADAFINVEEFTTQQDLGDAIVSVVNANGFGIEAGFDGDRVNFLNANTFESDLLLQLRDVLEPEVGFLGVSGGNIAIPFLVSDSAAEIATRINDALNANGESSTINDILVTLDAGTFTNADAPFEIRGLAPGGKITGLEFIDGTMYAVSDAGGLFIVNDFEGTDAFASYVDSSVRLQGENFAGLTKGPQNVEGGAYASTLFAIETDGTLHAFDTAGTPEPIFVDGQSNIPTGASGANGLSFSTLDENLWNLTDYRSTDEGHGNVVDPELIVPGSPPPVFGGNSFHFGQYTSPGIRSLEEWEQILANDANVQQLIDASEANRFYDFPGGAYGSLVSGTFDLTGISANAVPTLYFNYLLATDRANDGSLSGGTDTFRVFVGGDDGQWELLASNAADAPVQLIDSDWEDAPTLLPDEPVVAGETLLERDGIQEPFTDARQDGLDSGGSTYIEPNEEATIWRQARVDLSEFVGQDNLRIRLDFSTAGNLDVGNTAGEELHAIDGNRLFDGDTFTIGDAVFEFDLGFTISLPESSSIADGETLTVIDSVGDTFILEFDNDGTVADGAIPVQIDGTAQDMTTALVDGLMSIPTLTIRTVNNRIQLNGAEQVTAGLGSEVVVDGVPGVTLGDGAEVPDNIAIVVDFDMTAEDVANEIRAAVAATFANDELDTVKIFENRVFIHGRNVADPGPLGLTTGLDGDSFFIDLSRDNLRGNDNNARQVEVDGTGGGGGGGGGGDDNNFFITYEGAFVDDFIIGFAARGEEVVDLRGTQCLALHTATGEPVRTRTGGGASIDCKAGTAYLTLPGDEQPRFVPDDGQQGGGQGGAGGDGFAVAPDGFLYTIPYYAEGDRDYAPYVPEFDTPPDLTGPYQLEIRVASGSDLDIRDRLVESTTIVADAGLNITDGQVLVLTDGVQTVEFEFNNIDLENGLINPAAIEISYVPTTDAQQVAELIRDAINEAENTGLDITASLDDGTLVGSSVSRTDRVSLFGETIEVLDDGGLMVIRSSANETSGAQNVARAQNQVIISSNTISNSQLFGIYVGNDERTLPQEGDYIPAGSGRNLSTSNPDGAVPGIVISNNVLDKGRLGGIRVGSDPSGFVFIPPIAGAPPEGNFPVSEVWETGTPQAFQFIITDRQGRTALFEFDSDGNVAGGAIPVDFTPRNGDGGCPTFDDQIDCELGRFDPLQYDVGDAIIEAITVANLDVDVIRALGDELYIEGAINVEGINADPRNPRFIGTGSGVLKSAWIYEVQSGLSAFSRIANNTIIGIGGPLTDEREVRVAGQFEPKLIDDHSDAGIIVLDNASPTLINNVIVNTEVGILGDATTSDRIVLGATVYQSNLENRRGLAIGEFDIEVPDFDADGPLTREEQLVKINELFVDFENANFYPAENSVIIDSSIDSLEDRPQFARLRDPLGIELSPLLAPANDVLGQLRIDDPMVEPPDGFGDAVFKDRGALDRVDFEGPAVELSNPRDGNVSAGQLVTNFEISFVDDGTGVDPLTVDSSIVEVRQDDELLVVGVDYRFVFDQTNDNIRIIPIAGVWSNESVYEVTVLGGAAGPRDVADNQLEPGTTTFTIDFTDDGGGGGEVFSWQNVATPLDVNNDGFVIAQDVLLVVNELNNSTVRDPNTGLLPTLSSATPNPPGFVDVNGDGFATAADALAIINFINSQSNGSGEGEPAPLASLDAQAAVAASSHDTDPIAQLSDPVDVTRHAVVDQVQPTALMQPAGIADDVFGPVQLDGDLLDDNMEDIMAAVVDDLADAWGDALGDDDLLA